MFYARTIDIPASTEWSDPEELVFTIPAGQIIEWYIHGAPEHQHQVSIAVYYMEHRIFPEGEEEYFYPSEIPSIFKANSWILPGIRFVTVRGANTDDTYEHSVYVGITVQTFAIVPQGSIRVLEL